MDSQNPVVAGGMGAQAQNVKYFLYGLGGLLVLVLVIMVVTVCVRVYRFGSTDKFTTVAAKMLHLPALKINGETISYADYADDLKAIRVMRDFDKTSGGQGASYTDEQLSDQVLIRLANNVLIEQAAKQYKVVIDEKEIEDLKSRVLSQFKTTAEAETELSKRYGWDLATYEKKVMRPYVLQNKLSEMMASDQSTREGIRNLAQKILNEIKGGADFAQMAAKYGTDGTKTQGGDLGWFGRGEMVPQFENVAFGLKKGELAPELTETQFGYHIIKLTDTKTEAVKDSKGKSIQEPKVRASHILFPFPNLGQYLDEAIKKAEYHLYLKVHDPFAEVRQADKTAEVK